MSADPHAPEQRARGRAAFDAATSIALCMCVLAPAIDFAVRPVDARLPHSERRPAAPMPAFPSSFGAVERFPRAFEARFLDTFGLRDALLSANSLVALEVFHRSPVKRATLGADGWMFLGRPQVIADFRGLCPFTAAELDALCDGLAARRDALARRDIAYLAVVAPNKESLYPELVSRSLDNVGPTRLEQLTAALAQREFDSYLDLRAPLRAAKDETDEPVYRALSTHWSPRGSLVAYRAIVDRVRARLPRVPPEPALVLRDAPELDDSYARAMYLQWRYPGAPQHWLPRSPRARVIVERRRPGAGVARRTAIDDPALPRALLLHDSFGQYVEKLLAEHFGALTCIWTRELDDALLESTKPDIVIDMIVERRIHVWFAHGAIDDE